MVLDWSPPHEGCLKLNFDGASKGNPGPAGFGCVLRDHLGRVLHVIYGPLCDCDSTSVEVFGPSHGSL